MRENNKKSCKLLAQFTGALNGCVIIPMHKNDDTFNNFFQVRATALERKMCYHEKSELCTKCM